jgi:hypothetical protein
MTALVKGAALIEGRTLLPAPLANRLVARVTAEHHELPPGMPARILDQALAFLGTCATATEPIGPSDLVDIGWHTFILYTHEYATFCDRIAGRFIHHVPDDRLTGGERPKSREADRVTLAATTAAMRLAGYRVDARLWSMTAVADCTQCHAGCTDSPTR